MLEVLNHLLTAADNHGEDDDPDHTVGDLQGLLRQAWGIMSISQRKQLLNSDEVEDLIMLGARGEFEVEDLVGKINAIVASYRAVIEAAGYRLMQTEGAFFWETETEVSEDFYDEADAIEAAFIDMKGKM